MTMTREQSDDVFCDLVIQLRDSLLEMTGCDFRAVAKLSPPSPDIAHLTVVVTALKSAFCVALAAMPDKLRIEIVQDTKLTLGKTTEEARRKLLEKAA
jgi:hypothetical protein